MSQMDCPRCGMRYVDPSPAAMLEPRPCPQCKAKPPSVVETVVAARDAKIRKLEAELTDLRRSLRKARRCYGVPVGAEDWSGCTVGKDCPVCQGGELEPVEGIRLLYEAELEALRSAVRALLADLDSPSGDGPLLCDDCQSVLATRADPWLTCLCDACGNEGRELSYAPALRRLRELLAAPSGQTQAEVG